MNPFEVVKLTQQVHRKKHLRTLATARYVIVVIDSSGFGIEGLYRGITAFITRNVVFDFTYFGVYHVIKEWLPAAHHPGSELLRRMAIAGFSGAISCSLSNSFDVAKCRIQAPQPVKGEVKYRRTIPTLRTIYREEGILTMFKVLTPLLMSYISGGAILMVSYDAFYEFLILRRQSK